MPGTFRTLFNQCQICCRQYHLLKTPFLVIMGGVEKIIDPFIGEDMMKYCINVEDKEYLYYKDAWHYLWGEEEINEIIPKMVEWIQKRI